MGELVEDYPWLQSGLSLLNNYITQKRIPQALLITGQSGYGKFKLAEHYALSILCQDRSQLSACGKCQSCTLFKAQTHPDYLVIEPEEAGKAIGIGIIRQLVSQLSLKPQFEAYRAIIIKSADSLNTASANAFLKYLEEPTERTCLILVSDNPGKLPATIRSRCQKLHIARPEKSLLKKWLAQQNVSEDIDLLINLSQGSPLLAKQFSDQTILDFRIECFKGWVDVAHNKGNFIALAEQWANLEKTKLDLLLLWLTTWVVDAIKLLTVQQTDNLYNFDLVTDLQELTQRLSLKDLFNFYDFLLISQQRLDRQLNKQLMLEEILIKWSKLNSR